MNDCDTTSSRSCLINYKLTTPIWDRNHLLEAYAGLPEFLRSIQVEFVDICPGWGWRLPIDDLWKDQEFAVEELAVYLETAEATGTGWLGDSDLIVVSKDPAIEVVFHHESYVFCHFADEDSMIAFREYFVARGLAFAVAQK
jgi:hypothetical protein